MRKEDGMMNERRSGHVVVKKSGRGLLLASHMMSERER